MPDEEGTPVVNEVAVPDAAPTESTTAETNSAAADEPAEQSTDPSTQEPSDADHADESTDSEESDAADDTNTEQPKKGADARKEQLNNEIRDLVAQRNALRHEVEQINAEAYKPASVDELLEQVNPDTGDYYNRLEAQLEAMRQEREVEKYNTQIAESRLTLQTETQRALQDFPMFDQQSPDYNADVAQEVDAILQGVLELDPKTNQVIGSRISVYQLLKSYAKAAEANARKAEIKAQRNAEKQLTNADPTPGGAGKTKAFNELSTAEMAARLRKLGHDV